MQSNPKWPNGSKDSKPHDQRTEVRGRTSAVRGRRSEVRDQNVEGLQAALANRYEGGSVQARVANEVQKLKCRSPGQHQLRTASGSFWRSHSASASAYWSGFTAACITK